MPPKSKQFFQFVRKRDGRLVNFDGSRIASAIAKAMKVTGEGVEEDAERLAKEVVDNLLNPYPDDIDKTYTQASVGRYNRIIKKIKSFLC